MFKMQFGFSASPPLKSGQVLCSSPSWVAKPAASLLTAPNMHLAQLHRLFLSLPRYCVVLFASTSDRAAHP
jgi:hypothetical protein